MSLLLPLLYTNVTLLPLRKQDEENPLLQALQTTFCAEFFCNLLAELKVCSSSHSHTAAPPLVIPLRHLLH